VVERPWRRGGARAPGAGAVLDATGAYRYRLWRRWGAGPAVVFVLLNPSSADANRDDPTLRRCAAFARRWGYPAVEVVNLFGYRGADPRCLRAVADPVGPANDGHLRRAARAAGLVVAGWGTHGRLHGRDGVVGAWLAAAVPERLACLGTTASGLPRHPLRVPGSALPVPWRPEAQGSGGPGPSRRASTSQPSSSA
jgi:hypothetical protein